MYPLMFTVSEFGLKISTHSSPLSLPVGLGKISFKRRVGYEVGFDGVSLFSGSTLFFSGSSLVVDLLLSVSSVFFWVFFSAVFVSIFSVP